MAVAPTATRHQALISSALALPAQAVAAALRLLEEGATVPFIARYRKEATEGLDEVQLRAIDERRQQLDALDARRAAIEKEIDGQGKLTDALAKKLRAATTRAELEDLYAPFKPRRRTRATIARERGLEPLALQMWRQDREQPERAARAFINPKREVPDVDAALAGARDICAERLADEATLRARLREAYVQHGQLQVKKTKAHREERTKFDDYAAFSGRVKDMPSHRLLAIARGENEGVLQAKLEIDLARHQRFAASRVPVRNDSPWRRQLEAMVEDALKRLLAPSAQSECRSSLKRDADAAAVDVFAKNLRQLLLAPPFGERVVLAIDPGQRTGCKCAVLDKTGKPVAFATLFLVQGEAKQREARATLEALLSKHRVEAVAVGNGTHGRETERFVKDTLKETGTKLEVTPVCVSVSESGASIYSASEDARREFPDLDLTLRGAISIGRRLQDPLAELVKLDPKTIGVGQYQHDVDQGLLARRLSEVVESCVNQVGVELNTASARLLSHVCGIGPKLAERIVEHRDGCGPFETRQQLRAVKGLGPKAYEQAAGFLRIRGGKQPLDESAVHPERYALVQRMAKDLNVRVEQLVGRQALVERIDASRYRDANVGDYTLADIIAELQKPGRDPRAHFEAPRFKDDVSTLSDLKPGMELEGVVTNVTAFGAFVDVGVHQDGLCHVSQLADRFVRDPAEVVHVGQTLRVRVLEVDPHRKRISLSAKQAPRNQ
ncbi:MAG: RNA-binding transcriptional accessory protein [Myxococcales bacterium]|nr:RNA-binding transcriptional accessory protein [Myxococcales bacterium]